MVKGYTVEDYTELEREKEKRTTELSLTDNFFFYIFSVNLSYTLWLSV